MSSILDDNRIYQARLVKGFLQTGQVNVTIVPELVKPHNNVLLMRMLANVLGITEANKQRYNLDDNFLSKPVQIVIGVLDCQVDTVSMQKEGLKNAFLHPRLLLLQAKAGVGLSFQGCMGASEEDF